MSQGKPWLLPLALVLLVLWLGWRFWLAYQPEPVRLQGQIEAQQYSVSSKVAGRIDEVLVKKGINWPGANWRSLWRARRSRPS